MAKAHTQLKRQPAIVPLKYAGQWIAWNHNQTRIVASGNSFIEAKKAAHEAGEADPIFAKAPRADVRFVGAGA